MSLRASLAKKLGIGRITTLFVCTIILIRLSIPIFRYLVGRCAVNRVPTPTIEKTQTTFTKIGIDQNTLKADAPQQTQQGQRRSQAAVYIQKAYRQRARKKHAITTIQNAFRYYQAHETVKKLSAAVCIQKAYRGHQARKKEKLKSAVAIQRAFRSHQAQKKHGYVQAVVRIQQAYRYHCALKERIRLQAITIIQTAFRYYQAHAVMEKLSSRSQPSKVSQASGMLTGALPHLPAKSEQFDKRVEIEKTFKKQLKKLHIYSDDGIENVADKLFKIVPPEIELQAIPSYIFASCRPGNIKKILKAIQYKHPSFVFSPYDEIRKAIVMDTKHELNNDSLIAMLKQAGLARDQEKITACYDLAFRMKNPHIYPPSSKSVFPKHYCLNFLWVNLNPQDRGKNEAQNIFGDGLNRFENAECIKDSHAVRRLEAIELILQGNSALKQWQLIKKSFTYRLSKWADKHPNVSINLWYDSALVTRKAKEKTEEMLQSIAQSRKVDLRLRDVRQIPTIQGEIALSLHPSTQLYFRIDYLKLLIADHMMTTQKESARYCVVTDIDVAPMSSEELFDGRTEHFLLHNGYVFTIGLGNFENSFFIFNKTKENLRQEHSKIIYWTKNLITDLRKYPKGTPFKPDGIMDSQRVFRYYSVFLEKMGRPLHKRVFYS